PARAAEMTTATLSTPVWTDKKRYLWLLGIVVMGLPLYGYGLYQWTGLSLFFWTPPIIVYTLIPLLDRLIGEDDSNPPDSIMAALAQEKYYRYVVYAAIPVQYISFVWGTWLAVHGGLAWHQYLGLLISVGMTSGLAI